MVPKLATTKTFAIVMGLFAGLSLSAPAAEAGMRIYVGFPVGGFYVGGGHYRYHGHKYDWGRYNKTAPLKGYRSRTCAEGGAGGAKTLSCSRRGQEGS